MYRSASCCCRCRSAFFSADQIHHLVGKGLAPAGGTGVLAYRCERFRIKANRELSRNINGFDFA
jgi:hypothetical protein